MSFEELVLGAENRVFHCGLALPYVEMCPGYTVTKLSVWQHLEDDQFQILLLQEKGMPTARVEGLIYSVSHEELKELDNKLGNGVQCSRKRLPVWAEVKGALHRTYAYVYIQNRDVAERIKFYQQVGRPNYAEANRVMSSDSLRNLRYVFPTPVYNNGHVGPSTPEMDAYVKRKNYATMEPYYLSQWTKEQEQKKQERKRQRWERFKNFLNE